MARRIVDVLLSEELIVPDVDRSKLAQEIEILITEELSVEDRINDEVRQILSKYEDDISKGRVDFRRLFDLTKQKIVKERGVIL